VDVVDGTRKVDVNLCLLRRLDLIPGASIELCNTGEEGASQRGLRPTEKALAHPHPERRISDDERARRGTQRLRLRLRRGRAGRRLREDRLRILGRRAQPCRELPRGPEHGLR
jgi:hypothetical protein